MPGFLTRLVQRALVVPAAASSHARSGAFEEVLGPDAATPAAEQDGARDAQRAAPASAVQALAQAAAPSGEPPWERTLAGTPGRTGLDTVLAGAVKKSVAPAMDTATRATQPAVRGPVPVELPRQSAAHAALPAPLRHSPQAIDPRMPGRHDGGPPLPDTSPASAPQATRDMPPRLATLDAARTAAAIPPIDHRQQDPGDAPRQPPLLAPVALGPAAARPAAAWLPEPRARMTLPAPEVHVTIGRVELRTAAPPATRPSSRAAAPRPALSLADYLARRDAGGSR
ncbi:hypothetical protein [Variovorax sp. JS1663]|uniref:hypothetical protein n=1 Tax=Variovorax sp. JS1663 TaxID=1851577 RepID=UPI000B6DD3BA|nr:hypothetical protein [Variovorax sp. JS1663]OUL98522.1 hypothetical protein A8M77_31155 [Variovorax sp. JS1663]